MALTLLFKFFDFDALLKVAGNLSRILSPRNPGFRVAEIRSNLLLITTSHEWGDSRIEEMRQIDDADADKEVLFIGY